MAVVSILHQHGEERITFEEFEEHVRSGNIHPDTLICIPAVTGERFVPARSLEVFQSLYSPERIRFMRTFRLDRFPFVSAALVLLNLSIFTTILIAEGGIDLAVLVRYGAKVNPYIIELAEFWRFLTANLLHHNWPHLLFNLAFLFALGWALENAYRTADYLWFLVVCAGASTGMSFLMSERISAGASGLVFGLLGGLAAFGYKYGDLIPRRYRLIYGFAAVPYAAVAFTLGLGNRGIDNWGHLGGLIGGVVAAALLPAALLGDSGVRRPPLRLRLLRLVQGATTLAVLLLLLAPPVLRPLLPVLEEAEGLPGGITAAYPSSWRRLAEAPHFTVFGNGHGTSLKVRAEDKGRVKPLEELVEDYLAREVWGPEANGEIDGVSVWGETRVTHDHLEGIRFDCSFTHHRIHFHLRAYIFLEGTIEYSITFGSPADRFNRYLPLFNRMLTRLRFPGPDLA